MHDAPAHVTDAEVLATVVATWDAEVDAVEHLPVGFGAYHWAASTRGERRLFVTLDRLGSRHDLASLTAAYRAAAALDLALVHACLPPWVVPITGGALSVTPWLDGVRPDELDVTATATLLDGLHRAAAPEGIPRWRPVVDAGLADHLRHRVATPWTSGPYAEQAWAAIARRLDDLDTWVARYHRLASDARGRTWVPTHGEPGPHNQLLTADGIRLVDWESLKLAPAERDLRTVGAGDTAMLELFALEWRLDEVAGCAAWLQDPHTGTSDDRETLDVLLAELTPPA